HRFSEYTSAPGFSPCASLQRGHSVTRRCRHSLANQDAYPEIARSAHQRRTTIGADPLRPRTMPKFVGRPRMRTPPGSPNLRTILTAVQISGGIDQLARQLAVDYRGRPLTVLGVLTGSLIFLSDLIRRLDIPLRVGLIQASSYRGRTTAPGRLSIAEGAMPD